jgi:ankyrin repeat protein
MAHRGGKAAEELTEAIQAGDTEALGAFLALGANPNAVDARGLTPLCVAAELSNVEAAKALLGAG